MAYEWKCKHETKEEAQSHRRGAEIAEREPFSICPGNFPGQIKKSPLCDLSVSVVKKPILDKTEAGHFLSLKNFLIPQNN